MSTSNAKWMSNISDTAPIRDISIPGTHDSCACKGCVSWHSSLLGPFVYTQKQNLIDQLNMGVRFLDIRCRHTDNTFTIHHGSFYLNINFDNVLEIVTNFLTENSTETILMRLKQEHKPQNNTQTFEETMSNYYYNSQFTDYFWRKNNCNDPKLGDCRGKIVILQNFNYNNFEFGLDYYWSFNRQDDYEVAAIERKIESIINCLKKCENGETSIINYLSGVGRLAVPTPHAVSNKTNNFMLNYLKKNNCQYVGIVACDFIDETLVSLIINTNQK